MFFHYILFWLSRFGFSRVTSDKTAEWKDVTLLKIADLDRSPSNKIVSELSSGTSVNSMECPHHIVVGAIKIIGQVIRQAKLGEQPAALQKPIETEKILDDLKQNLTEQLADIKNDMQQIKLKLKLS